MMELEKQSKFEKSDETIPGNIEDFPADPNSQLDLPPEFCRYRDEGCDLADSCLNCPFVKCIYDEPRGKQGWSKRLRAREMARLFTTEGKGIKELALLFGVSQRTVQRVLKVALDNSVRRGQKNESRL